MHTEHAPSVSHRIWVVVVFLSVIWASAFPLTALTVIDLPPLVMVAWRLSIASALLCAYQFYKGQPVLLKHWKVYLWLGLLGNVVPFALIGWGIKVLPGGVCSLIIGTVPLFTVLIAHVQFADERLTRRTGCGILLGFAGVVSLFWPLPVVPLPLLPLLALLASAICYAFTITELKRYTAIPFLARATGMMLTSALVAWLIVALQQPAVLMPPAPLTWLHLILLGALPSALAMLLLGHLLERGSVTLVGFSNYLTPIFGVLLSALFLDESLNISLLLALALVLSGMALTRKKSQP